MKRIVPALVLATLLLPLLPAAARAQKITKETLNSAGKERTYYLFVPESASSAAGAKVPLLLTLHGSGRDGKSLVSRWDKLAKKEGFIVAGPDALDSQSWQTPGDGPDFLRELVDALSARLPVDPKRVYLFGHSAGAVFALNLAMLESEYFAAIAVHAGSWRRPEYYRVMQYAKRKIPIGMISGDKDEFFPIQTVRATRDKLAAEGFPVELKEMPGHDHWYYDLAARINRDAWEFLAKQALAGEPIYEQHRFSQ